MTDSTLANLPSASTLDGTEILYAVQGGADKKATATQLKTFAKAGFTKADAGLSNVDNTSDVNKPVSTAQAAADALKEDIGSYTAGINSQTGTSYTPVLADKGALVEMNNASANTFTVPPNSSVAFPLKTRIDLVQMGAGQTTIAAGGGVTIRSSGGKRALAGQYSGATLIKRGADEWVLLGDIA